MIWISGHELITLGVSNLVSMKCFQNQHQLTYSSTAKQCLTQLVKNLFKNIQKVKKLKSSNKELFVDLFFFLWYSFIIQLVFLGKQEKIDKIYKSGRHR